MGKELGNTVTVEPHPQDLSKRQLERERKRKLKADVVVRHVDIIQDSFWNERPWILTGQAPKAVTKQP